MLDRCVVLNETKVQSPFTCHFITIHYHVVCTIRFFFDPKTIFFIIRL